TIAARVLLPGPGSRHYDSYSASAGLGRRGTLHTPRTEQTMTQGTQPISLSKMAREVQPSATLAAGAKAKQLKAEGIAVFDFSLGEPDFTTPEHICQAAVKAMKEGHTHYTPAAGIPELRAAVARSYKRIYGIQYIADQVVISGGAKHS